MTDPAFKTIEMICDQVRAAGDRAALVDLNTIAQSVNRGARRRQLSTARPIGWVRVCTRKRVSAYAATAITGPSCLMIFW